MSKAKKAIITSILGIAISGSGVIAVTNPDCVVSAHKVKMETGHNWCLSKANFKKETDKLIKNVKEKKPKTDEDHIKASALIKHDKKFRNDLAFELVTMYQYDEYVDVNNYNLHLEMMNEHFKNLKAENSLPAWYLVGDDLTDKEKIDLIHNSLLNNK